MMKKLLYIFLAISIIFSACKKEEDEPTNSGNNNTGNDGGTTVLTWEKTYFDGVGDEKGGADCINQTSDNGYVILCNAVSDIHFLMKIDENGDEEWRQEQFNLTYDFDYLGKTNDEGFIISGSIDDSNNGIHLTKVNEYGNLQWSSIIQQEGEVQYISETIDGGYIILSENLIKTNSQGILEWTKDFNLDAVSNTNDGGYIISNSDSLIKLNSNGNIEWEKKVFIITANTPEYDFKSIEETNDGGYILAGSSGDKPNYELLLAKIDLNGNLEWDEKFGGVGSGGDMAKQTIDGGYIIVGHTRVLSNGSKDVYFVKTDLNGNRLIGKTFGGIDSDDGLCVSETNDGGYVIGAETESFGSNNIYIIKIDANGNL